MQLITGGMGFIGLHAARAFLDAGEDVVLTRYRNTRTPSFIADEIDKRLFVEALDLTSAHDVLGAARKYPITGIVHLAAPPLGALSAAEDFRVNMSGLINVLEAARLTEVGRVAVASSGTVYRGVAEGPYTEDMPLPLPSGGSTPAYKKSYEILGQHYAERTGLDVIYLRLNGVWGPAYQSMVNLPSRLVHAAVRGEPGPLKGRMPDPLADDMVPSAHVKDCARAIQVLQSAGELAHRVYNVASGQPVHGRDFVAAVLKAIPEAEVALKPGQSPNYQADAYLDISRLTEDTGFEPAYTEERGIAEYIEWLRVGNDR